MEVFLAGDPEDEAGAPAAAIHMHASDEAVSSAPVVSSCVDATGDPVVSSAFVEGKVREVGHCVAARPCRSFGTVMVTCCHW